MSRFGADGGNRTRDTGMARRHVATTLRPQWRGQKFDAGEGTRLGVVLLWKKITEALRPNVGAQSEWWESNPLRPGSEPGCLPVTYTQRIDLEHTRAAGELVVLESPFTAACAYGTGLAPRICERRACAH